MINKNITDIEIFFKTLCMKETPELYVHNKSFGNSVINSISYCRNYCKLSYLFYFHIYFYFLSAFILENFNAIHEKAELCFENIILTGEVESFNICQVLMGTDENNEIIEEKKVIV